MLLLSLTENNGIIYLENSAGGVKMKFLLKLMLFSCFVRFVLLILLSPFIIFLIIRNFKSKATHKKPKIPRNLELEKTDVTEHKYCYHTDMSRNELIESLSHSDYSSKTYSVFDRPSMTLKVKAFASEGYFSMTIEEYDRGCFIFLKRQALYQRNITISRYTLDKHMWETASAVPVSLEEYENRKKKK